MTVGAFFDRLGVTGVRGPFLSCHPERSREGRVALRSRTGLCPAARGLDTDSVAKQTVHGSRGAVPKISRLRRRVAAAPLEMTHGAYAHTPPQAARSFSPLQARETYIFNDPMAGKNVAYPKEQVEEAFEGVGMQAVVLESVE